MGLFDKLKKGLEKTRNSIMGNIGSVFSSYEEIGEDFYEELEESLILGDMGMETAVQVVETLRTKAKERKLQRTDEVYELFKEEISRILETQNPDIVVNGMTNVILVIGVNGAGKTTTIGKLAHKLKSEGKKVLMVAGDTFRAGAIQQLDEWASNIGCDIVYKENADPVSVMYDGVNKAKDENYDIVLIDTAGRLQNKVGLMKELEKVNKVIGKLIDNAPHETLLVIDATTGQNGISQAKSFKEITNITGIVLTKLEGTAKGGIVLAIKEETGIPVKYVGLGETKNDLRTFDIEKYIYGLFKGMDN